MARKIVSLALAALVALAVLGLSGCGAGNVLKGSLTMPKGADTPREHVKLWVFRLDSGKDPVLYAVDKDLRFKITLAGDGEYLVEGVVDNDPGYYTKQLRVVVKNGKIENNKTLALEFKLMNID
jgi:hypothetical protein